MKLFYESPQVEVIDFRAIEAMAFDGEETGPGLDIGPSAGGNIGGDLGVEDWDWNGN